MKKRVYKRFYRAMHRPARNVTL